MVNHARFAGAVLQHCSQPRVSAISANAPGRKNGAITGDDFSSTIYQDTDGKVSFTADADIDADCANGQGGGPAAYMSDDSGSEALANGGMKIVNGRSSTPIPGPEA